MHHLHDPPSDALLRFAHSCSFAALSRRPSLRSARGCATRQASPAVSLSLKRQASPAARTLSLAASARFARLTGSFKIELAPVRCGPRGRASVWGSVSPPPEGRLISKRAGVVALFLGRT